MEVLSPCPLRVASIVWQPRPGAFALTVVCKATFLLEPGTSPFTGEQDKPHERDVPWDNDERASLRWASDLVPFKRRPEVLLVGHAHAPGGQPVSSLVVRLVVGEVDKVVEVHGDRWITPDDRISEASRFVKAPLRWEHAAGGPGTCNPVGMRLDGPAVRGAVAVANLTPPHVHVTYGGDEIQPVGFGPIAPTWPGRLHELRHHAASWDHARWHASPLSEDIDAGYFNAAPPDQQTSEIRPDERLVLEHLHPRHARLSTNLQALAPRAVFASGGGPEQALRLRCDTLSIDTDRGTASLVWRTYLLLNHPEQSGRILVTLDPGATPSRVAKPEAAPAGSQRQASALAGTTSIDPEIVRRAALPFGAGGSAPGAQPATLPRWVAAPAGLAGTGSIDPQIVRQGAMLPFGAGIGAPAPPRVPASLAALVGAAWIDHGLAGHEARAGFHDETAGGRRALAAEEAPWIAVATDPPAPPPMIGPLAGLPVTVAEPPSLSASAAPVTTKPEPEPVLPAPSLDGYPVERCAAIAASVARSRSDRAAILERNDFTEETWKAVERRWAGAISEEATRGKAGLLRAYDEAYLAQLEVERGPITVKEYARLVVAAERGTEPEALVELGLPRGAMLRVQRVWMKKMSALGRQVREAVEAEREG